LFLISRGADARIVDYLGCSALTDYGKFYKVEDRAVVASEQCGSREIGVGAAAAAAAAAAAITAGFSFQSVVGLTGCRAQARPLLKRVVLVRYYSYSFCNPPPTPTPKALVC